jgi:hypothetical protein
MVVRSMSTQRHSVKGDAAAAGIFNIGADWHVGQAGGRGWHLAATAEATERVGDVWRRVPEVSSGLSRGNVILVPRAICVDARADEEAGMIGGHVTAIQHVSHHIGRLDALVKFHADE